MRVAILPGVWPLGESIQYFTFKCDVTSRFFLGSFYQNEDVVFYSHFFENFYPEGR